jgi:hypothetical protein
MNGNELADELEIAQGNNNADELIPEAITMLRQQQAEIAELKVMLGHYEDVYEGVVTHPVKELTLTEDEIDDVWAGCSTGESEFIDMHLFAEAILRKAQEK